MPVPSRRWVTVPTEKREYKRINESLFDPALLTNDGDPDICLTDKQKRGRAPQLEAPPLPLLDIAEPLHQPIEDTCDDEKGVTLVSSVEDHAQTREGEQGPATPMVSHNVHPEYQNTQREQDMEPVIEADAELDPHRKADKLAIHMLTQQNWVTNDRIATTKET